MKNKKTNEGIFSAADKFVNAFFNGLEKNTANQVIRAAEKSKLSPDAVKLMKDIDDRGKELRKIMKNL
jgi:5S rRNA maturation endonuclease (ribonuclease M5)